MPRRRTGPRLHLRKQAKCAPVWIIKDGDKRISTGCGESDREGAERALEEYIAQKWTAPQGGERDMTIADVLTIYGREHAPTTADPARIGNAIAALLTFWADKRVSAIKGETCRRYMKLRDRAPGTVRRELGCLKAALSYCETEGYILRAPAVWLPPKPAPRERWLSRREAAALIRAARSNPRTRHLARFILIGLYTGTRASAILGLEWAPSMVGGHVDLENGLIYRQSAAARRTKKRQTPVRIPARLMLHLRRWREADQNRFVIHYGGLPMESVKRAWRTTRERASGAGADLADVTPHTLRHTAITWAMQSGARIEDAAVFFGITIEELQRVYWHHSPHAQGSVVDSFSGKRA